MIVRTEFRDLQTPTGVMRCHLYAPAAPAGDKRYPGLVLYPEIYQQTGPIARLCAQFASHGYVVMAPEIYHEHEPPGTVLAYDAAGTDKGNAYKWSTRLSTWDADVDVVVRALKAHPGCSGRIGAVGFCIGGHLAFRAALHPEIRDRAVSGELKRDRARLVTAKDVAPGFVARERGDPSRVVVDVFPAGRAPAVRTRSHVPRASDRKSVV